MSETENRPGYSARMMTPYMNTTGKCIELFYWIYQKNVETYIHQEIETGVVINAVDEELRETIVIRSVGWDYVDFRRMFSPLPHGINRIAIDGIRDSNKLETSISVDDMTIMDCNKFGNA
jgi:hypothetical protein